MTAAQTSMNGWPTISTCCPIGDFAMPCGDPALLGSRDEVVDQDADPALGPGPEVAQVLGRGRPPRRGTPRRRPRSAGRRPTPSRPAPRRAGPRRRSGSAVPPAPCASWTATEPDAVRVGLAGAFTRAGAVRMTGRPSSRNPGPSGKVRRLPRRSSRVSVCRSRSTATISPHQSVVTSSTTAPSSAGASTARPRFGTRQSVARTSEP